MSDLEIPQSLSFEKSKQRINFNKGCLLNRSFWELGGSFLIFKQASENSTCGTIKFAMRIC